MSIWNYREAYELREQQAEAERESARERDRQERLRADEHRRRVQQRIDDRIQEIQMKREEREAAKIQHEHDLQCRLLARDEEKYPDRPYGRRGAGHADPVAEWREAVSEALAACGGNRQNAVIMANRRHPGLRESMLNVVNGRRVR